MAILLDDGFHIFAGVLFAVFNKVFHVLEVIILELCAIALKEVH